MVVWCGMLTGVVRKINCTVFMVDYDISCPYLSGDWFAVLTDAHVVGSCGCVLVAASFAVAVDAGVRVFGHVIAVGPAVATTVSENLGEALGTSLVVVAVVVVVAIAVVVVVVVGAMVLCSGVVVVVVIAADSIFESGDFGVFCL